VDVNWRHQAACRSEDPELFFPAGNTQPALDQLTEAKSVCRRCPAAGACLAWALHTDQRHGVWGGLSEEERHVVRQHSRRISGRAHLALISVSDPTGVAIGMGRRVRTP
jgi:WhiB family redox-sensing transcriptional regulator